MNSTSRRKPGWRRAANLMVGLSLILGLLDATPGARAEISPLNLWEKTRRAGLVARVTVLDGDNRLAVMQVDEIIKGSYDAEILKVVFRAANLSRKNWEERIVFTKGDHLILFVEPFVKNGVVKAKDQFVLVRGSQGKEDVPPEGTDAYLNAIRRFAEIQSLDSQLAIWDAARQLLYEKNPQLVEAGFQQVLKFQLTDQELVSVLLEHLESPNVPFRRLAARCLGRVFELTRDGEKVMETEDHVRDLLLHTAMNDQNETVRVESIKALEAKSDESLVPSFRQISVEDPSQAVRYQAAKSIFILKLKETERSSPAGSSP